MNIALIGYGKMGQAIDAYCSQNTNHNIVARIDVSNVHELQEKKDEIDVAIEFTQPEVAVKNYLACFSLHIPVVSGTTGWLEQWQQVEQSCKEHQASFFYASNFSIGVHLFWKLVEQASSVIDSMYQIQIDETHHIHKKDAPSGTAITTAEKIIKERNDYEKWVLGSTKERNQLPIFAHRKEEVPGEHTVTFQNNIDKLSISHAAFSRQGFVEGAVRAAEFLPGHTGIFGMDDLLNQ